MTEAVADTSAARLAFAVGKINRRLSSATGGLSHGLLSALAVVAKHGPVRLADLAQIEGVSAPSITRVVAELEVRGLVVRAVDPDDGRAFLIQVTDAGTDAVQRARAARSEVLARVLSRLDSEESAAIEAALPALEKLVAEL